MNAHVLFVDNEHDVVTGFRIEFENFLKKSRQQRNFDIDIIVEDSLSSAKSLLLDSVNRDCIHDRIAVIVCDMSFFETNGIPGREGLDILELGVTDPYCEVIVYSGKTDFATQIQCYTAGAFRYIDKLKDSEEVTSLAILFNTILEALSRRLALIEINDVFAGILRNFNKESLLEGYLERIYEKLQYFRGRKP